MMFSNDKLIYVVLVVIIVFAIVVRVLLPFNIVFNDQNVLLNTVDAYYFVYISDVMPKILEQGLFNFKENYLNYPHDSGIDIRILYPLICFWLCNIFNVDVRYVLAVLPLILFLISIVPYYLLARNLFRNKTIAILAVIILLTIAGQTLYRTMLGAGDYHSLEMLCFISIAYFVYIIGLGIINSDYKRVIIYYILGITVMTIYAFSWRGALLVSIAPIIALFTISYVYSIYTGRLRYAYSVSGAVVLIIMVASIGLYLLSNNNVIEQFTYGFKFLAVEQYPLLWDNLGGFDITSAYGEYGVGFYLSFMFLGIMLYRLIKYKEFNILFIIVYFIFTLALANYMRRFTYYHCYFYAILMAYGVYVFVNEIVVKMYPNLLNSKLITTVTMLLVIIVPNVHHSWVQASEYTDNYMSKSWVETCSYLRSFAPVENYLNAKAKEGMGVVAWWDKGYWIVAEGHMPVFAQPGLGDREYVARALISGDNLSNVGYIVIDEDTVCNHINSYIAKSNLAISYKDTFAYNLFYNFQRYDNVLEVYNSSDGTVKVYKVINDVKNREWFREY